MKVTQYNWNWWFVLSTISFIVLVNFSGFYLDNISKTVLWNKYL